MLVEYEQKIIILFKYDFNFHFYIFSELKCFSLDFVSNQNVIEMKVNRWECI